MIKAYLKKKEYCKCGKFAIGTKDNLPLCGECLERASVQLGYISVYDNHERIENTLRDVFYEMGFITKGWQLNPGNPSKFLIFNGIRPFVPNYYSGKPDLTEIRSILNSAEKFVLISANPERSNQLLELPVIDCLDSLQVRLGCESVVQAWREYYGF